LQEILSSIPSRSTKGADIITDTLKLDRSHYYIKRRQIVEKITFDQRTFYAKFERINEPLNDMIAAQHLNRYHVIATPLLRDNKTNYLVLEYRGAETSRFYAMSKHLIHSLFIKQYHYFQGKKRDYLLLFIPVESLSLEEADEQVRQISDALATRMPKEWKCFPDKTIPECYNIVTLPYEIFAI
jgi:hypothetical protein